MPREIDIVCPRCSGRVAAKGTYPSGQIYAAPADCLWSLACTRCTFRKHGVPFSAITPFFYEFRVSRCKVWAWNLEHLRSLCKSLNGECTEGDPYHGHQTYVPGAWLLKRNRYRIAKAIEQRVRSGSEDG